MTPEELPEATYDYICLLAHRYLYEDMSDTTAAKLEQEVNDYLQRRYPFGFIVHNVPCNRVEVRVSYHTRTYDIQFVET